MNGKRKQVQVFDCTLRDGEQAPGVVFPMIEKVELGKALSRAGVKTLDASFPAVSEDERHALSCMAKSGLAARIGATVRSNPEEVDLAKECGAETVFIFLPVSDILIKHKLRISKDEVEKRVKEVCSYSSGSGLETFFVAEDSARQDYRRVARLIDLAAEAGANGAILCDTVGVLTPDGIREHVQGVIKSMKRSLVLGIHCHNDFGLATANTITAVLAGVEIVTCTITGIGERAGNAALEEVVVSLEELLNIDTGINLCALPDLAATVEKMSGFFQVPNKPIIGRNVFTHESGVHVKGILSNPICYEALSPERVGRKSSFVFGKHSGRSLVRHILSRNRISLSEERITQICHRIKKLKEHKSKESIEHMQRVLNDYYRDMIGIPEEDFWKIVEKVNPCA